MKVLLVLPEYAPHVAGGIATYYRQLLPRCVARGCEVRVILGSPHTVGSNSSTIEGVHVEELEPQRFDAQRKRLARFAILPELQRLLAAAWASWEQAGRGAGFDVVETVDWGLGFIPWAVEERGLPLQVRLHGSIGQIETHDPREGLELQTTLVKLLESTTLPLADRIVTHARANQEFWASLLQREVEYEEPPVAVTSAPASRPTAQEATGLVIGRLQHWKGPSVLCEALRTLRQRAPTVHWVGRDMPFQRATQTMSSWLAREYPDVWGRTLRWSSSRPHEEVAHLQRAAAFGVIPSLWDVYNLACAEFMASSTPTICSRGAGAADLITDGVNGFSVEAGDSDALAAALVRCQNRDDQIVELGRRGRETIAARLDPDQRADEYVSAWSAVRRTATRQRSQEWLREFASPAARPAALRGILDQLPFREVATYAVSRGLGKLVERG